MTVVTWLLAHWGTIVTDAVLVMTDVTVLVPALANNPIYKSINGFLAGLKGGNL